MPRETAPRLIVRALAALFALSWLIVPGFGVPDLSVSWDPAWQVVLEAGWGTFATLLVGTAFVRLALSPAGSGVPLVQLAVVTAAFAASVPFAGDPAALLLVGLLALQTALVAAARAGLRDRTRVRPIRLVPWPPMLGVALGGAVPWSAYAAAMFRATRARAPLDVTVGIDHYAVQSALAVVLVLLPLVAAVYPVGRRAMGMSAGLAAAYLGLVSLAEPGHAGGLGTVWSALALVWGLTVTALAAAADRLQRGQLVSEVVEAERAL